eukprot:TRINITY_DN58248_c0_g1_i1.p1 TRINITY_DN58248_c0_g1~~TRINITY_DN58248_c0_g1_i1.p1  ORF type:complete len:740 (-),score=220.17 TRINITY_DN58248_c0_g1_i1:47-2158(-)
MDDAGKKEDAGLAAAIALAGGSKDEERFLGLALALKHGSALAADSSLRAKLLAAVDESFLQRLLRSQLSLRRIALAALRSLVADAAGAAKLLCCAAVLSSSCLEAVAGEVVAAQEASSEGGVQAGDTQEADVERCWGAEEVQEAMEVHRQLLRFCKGGAAPEAVAAADVLLGLLVPKGSLHEAAAEEDLSAAALCLVQEMLSRLGGVGASDCKNVAALLEETCLRESSRGSPTHLLALSLLAELVDAGGCPQRLDEVLAHALTTGEAVRVPALRLTAASLNRFGLNFGLKGMGPQLGRLRPLLSMASGELHLGLEGHVSKENLCAACMVLEAFVVALGRESDVVEKDGHLQDCSDCMRHVHRALGDIFDYCGDLAPSEVPPELPVVARLVAAWQLEDPRHFSAEFLRALPVFCRLPNLEFSMFLPSVNDLYDWHTTEAFGKVFEVAWETLRPSATLGWSQSEASEVRRQCSFMLAEVALDAAAYLPEAPFLPAAPVVPAVSSTSRPQQRESATAHGLLSGSAPAQLPRPSQAADAAHPGVQKLAAWSHALWHVGRSEGSVASSGAAYWEHGVLCGALLVSVPESAVAGCADAARGASAAGTWAAVADCLFSGKKVEPSTWRLAVRLAGFSLDRHSGLVRCLSKAARKNGSKLSAPPGAIPSDDDDDEWAFADRAADGVLRRFLESEAEEGSEEQISAAFDEMD